MSGHLIKSFLVLFMTVGASLAPGKTIEGWNKIVADVGTSLQELKNPALSNLERKQRILSKKKTSGLLFQELIATQTQENDEAHYANAWQAISTLGVLSHLEVSSNGQVTEGCDQARSTFTGRRLTANDEESAPTGADLSALELLEIMCGSNKN